MPNTVFSPFSSTERKILFVAMAAILVTCLSTYYIFRHTLTQVITATLINRSEAIFSLLLQRIPPLSLISIHDREDANTPLYRNVHRLMANTRHLTAVRYLYTAKSDDAGNIIYVVDGLSPTAKDFRHPGDPLEPEIIPMVRRCLNGQTMLDGEVLKTSWGRIIPACAPLTSGDTVVGALVIEYDLDDFAANMRRSLSYSLVTTGGIALGIALITAWLLRRMAVPLYRRLAYTDILTGVCNRNAFELDLRHLHEKGEENGLTLLSCDLNLLKTINDQRGHAAGDASIRALADMLQQHFEGTGQTYRTGGDEFITLLRDVAPDNVARTVQQIEDQARQITIAGFPLSFAWGVASFDADADADLHATLTRADTLMYARKRAQKEALLAAPHRQ